MTHGFVNTSHIEMPEGLKGRPLWPIRPESGLHFPPQVLLTLDDDLDTVRRDKIPVF